jgi:hypothetical protein
MFPFEVCLYFCPVAAVGISELRDLCLEYFLTKVKTAEELRVKCNVEFFIRHSVGKAWLQVAGSVMLFFHFVFFPFTHQELLAASFSGLKRTGFEVGLTASLLWYRNIYVIEYAFVSIFLLCCDLKLKYSCTLCSVKQPRHADVYGSESIAPRICSFGTRCKVTS